MELEGTSFDPISSQIASKSKEAGRFTAIIAAFPVLQHGHFTNFSMLF
jgi:hypothetical protein